MADVHPTSTHPECEFISLAYSPWSEKARWALDHHQVRYKKTPFQPLLDEPRLKRRLGRWRGRVSVPVFFDGRQWLTDSWDIATWADTHGAGPSLRTEEDEVQRLCNLGEAALEAARALGLTRILEHPSWALGMVPKALRPWLGPLALPIARSGIRRTLRKYGSLEVPLEQHADNLRAILDEVRSTLGEGDDGESARTLLDTFSYADVAIAQVLQMVEPANRGGFRINEEGRAGYRDPALAEAYADLATWRDALYRDHRPERTTG